MTLDLLLVGQKLILTILMSANGTVRAESYHTLMPPDILIPDLDACCELDYFSPSIKIAGGKEPVPNRVSENGRVRTESSRFLFMPPDIYAPDIDS